MAPRRRRFGRDIQQTLCDSFRIDFEIDVDRRRRATAQAGEFKKMEWSAGEVSIRDARNEAGNGSEKKNKSALLFPLGGGSARRWNWC